MSPRRILLLSLILVFPLTVCAQAGGKQELDDQLWEAARKGDVATVRALLDKGANVNARFRYGTTALFKAAERGHTEVVKLLLERGADVNVKDTFYGATAMTWALENKHVEVVRALLEKSAESVDGVLLTGAREGNAALVRMALDRGGAKAESLTAALAAAMSDEKKAEIAELLRRAGAVPPFTVDAEVLQSYAGKYKSEPGTEINVTLKEGKLFATPPGQSPFGGYDLATGKELWRLTPNSEITTPTPFVAHDLIYVTSGYAPIQPIYAIRPGASGDITLKEGTESNEFIAWSKKRGGPYMPTPIVYGDLLYVCSNQGVMTAYNAKTGERVYQQRLADRGGAFTASMVASDGKIYMSSEDGEIFVVKAGPKHELLSVNPMGEVLMATPAISDGMLIVRGVKHLFAIVDNAAPPVKTKK